MRDLVLAGGRSITLRSIDQRLTYAGLLEELPTVEMNRRLLDRLVIDASLPDQGPVLLIEPVSAGVEEVALAGDALVQRAGFEGTNGRWASVRALKTRGGR